MTLLNPSMEYPPDDELAEFIRKKLSEGKKVALAVIVEKRGSAPRGEGSKIAITQDGETIGTIGGGEAERLVIKEALKALSESKPRTIKVSLYRDSLMENVKKTNQLCGGVVTVFIDVLKPRRRAIIVGAGHMARVLSSVMSFLGHEVIVIDNFPQHATKEKLPSTDLILVGEDPSDILIKQVNPREDDVILIVHGDGDLEANVIARLLEANKKVKYLGLLSGKGKLNYILRKLIERGIDAEKIESLLISPIGMDIGSETPEEIAVAVAAEIICRERKKEKDCMTENLVPVIIEKVRVKSEEAITAVRS